MQKNSNAPAQSLNEQFKTILTDCSPEELRELTVSIKDVQKSNHEQQKAEREQLLAERKAEREQQKAEREAQRIQAEALKEAQQTQKRQSLAEENERARQKLLTYVPSLEPFKFDMIKSLNVENYMKVPVIHENLIAFLETSYKYGGKIRLNEYSECIEYNGKKVDDGFYNDVRSDANVFFGKRITDYIDERLMTVARMHRYDPVIEYFNSLSWDGVPRISTLTHTLLNAKDRELYRTYLNLFFKATVKRNYEPGCKFEGVIILVGPQGIGKSILFERLGKRIFKNKGKGTFIINDNIIRDNRALLEQSRDSIFGIWDELSNFKKAEMDGVKTFASRQFESARAAYARETKEIQRRWTIVGSTNSEHFLRDDDPYERRFWIIRCEGFGSLSANREALEPLFETEFLDQLWAEAVHMYKEDPQAELTLSKEDEADARLDQIQYKAFYGDDAYETILERMESQFCIEGDTITSLVQLTQTPLELAARNASSPIVPHQVNKILSSALCEWTRKNGVYKYAKPLEQFLKGRWDYKKLRNGSRTNNFWVRVENENLDPTEKPNQIELVPEKVEVEKTETPKPVETPKPAETSRVFDASRRMILGVNQNEMTQYTETINSRIDANPTVQRNYTQKGQEYLTIDHSIQQFKNSPEAKQIENASNDLINNLNLNLN